MDLRSGQIVRHLRLGPAKVTEITPDRVTVTTKMGEQHALKAAEVDTLLTPMPEDGFCVWAWQKDISSDFIRDHIEETILRMMRDKRRRSITLDEIKHELSPIIGKERKGWNSWWKESRSKLTAGGKIAPDPAKKNLYVAAEGPWSLPVEDWESQVKQASSLPALLAVAKSVDLANEQEKAVGAASIAVPALQRFGSLAPSEQGFVEALCTLCYVLPYVDKAHVDTIIAAVDAKGFESIHLPAELDDELSMALGRLSRSAKVLDLARALLTHPSPQVQGRAFTFLNTEKYRMILKAPLLEWMRNPDGAAPPRPALFLRDDLLRHIRMCDLVRLYRLFIERPGISDNPPVKAFLSSAAISVLTAQCADDQLKLLVFRSHLVGDDIKSKLIGQLEFPEELVRLLVENFSPELDKALVCAIDRVPPDKRFQPWEPLLRLLITSVSSDLVRKVAAKLKERLEILSGADAFMTAAQVCDLLSAAEEHHPAIREVLESALEQIGRRWAASTPPRVPESLTRGIRAVNEAVQREARHESERRGHLNASLTADLSLAREENLRLLNLVERLKSSAAFDRYEVEANSRNDTIRPFLLLFDDLERQSSSGATVARGFILQLESAIERAGFNRVGSPGETVTFDPSVHEFLEAPGTIPPRASVRVVRSGYVIVGQPTPRVVRRALVRPAW